MARKRSKSKSSKKPSSRKTQIEIHRIAHFAFLIGIAIAIAASFFRSFISPEVLVTTLVVLGFIVGLFNLSAKETMPFLAAAVALMLAGIVNLGLIPIIGPWLRSVLSNIVVFVVPGAIIVGIKTIWHLAID